MGGCCSSAGNAGASKKQEEDEYMANVFLPADVLEKGVRRTLKKLKKDWSEIERLWKLWRSDQEFDIVEVVNEMVEKYGGIWLEPWEVGELNEAMEFVDVDGSGFVNGMNELKKLAYYAGLPETLAEYILKNYDKDGDAQLSFDEVQTFMGTVKAYSLFVYQMYRGQFTRKNETDVLVTRKQIEGFCDMWEKALSSAKCPPGMLNRIFHNADADPDGIPGIDAREFKNLILGKPNRQIQGERDMKICGLWMGKQVQNDNDMEKIDPYQPDEDETAKNPEVFLTEAQKSWRSDNIYMYKHDWKVLHTDFEKIFGVKFETAPNDFVKHITGDPLSEDDIKTILDPEDPGSIASLMTLLPEGLFKWFGKYGPGSAFTDLSVMRNLKMNDMNVGGLAGGGVLWLNYNYKDIWKNIFFHELWHLVDQNDNNVNDPKDEEWRACNPEGYLYACEREPRERNYAQSIKDAPEGFATGYGTTNVREDKACILGCWMWNRKAVKDRIDAGDKVLGKKVALLEQELTTFVPEFKIMIAASSKKWTEWSGWP